MKQDEFKPYFCILIIITLGIWFLLLKISGGTIGLTWQSLGFFYKAITIDLMLFAIYVKWLWKLPVFQGWLVKKPDLEGTWNGYLESTWIDPNTGIKKPPKMIQLVIRQNFLNINCTLLTQESVSRSLSAKFNIEEITGVRELVYTYINQPDVMIRQRSEIHQGTAMLQIIGKPPTKLNGEYWTNRRTTGNMSLTKETTDLVESFNCSISPQ